MGGDDRSSAVREVFLVVLRHAATEWNQVRRIQGHRDVPLSAQSRVELAARRLPAQFAGFRWVTSPLTRCQETARLLGAPAVEIEPRLREMDWAQWEARSLAELRECDPIGMARNEARGLDFRPLGGESPREVRARVREWLGVLAGSGPDTVAVSHKGVIRALLSAATGWDMTHKPPVKMDWRCAQLFAVGSGGSARLVTVNVPLVERSGRG